MHDNASTAAGAAVQRDRRKLQRLALATLCTAVLIAQVDTSVVNLAVHPIGAYFKAGVGSLQWVVDSYNLFYAILLLTGGLLADLYGRRRVFMTGAAVFTLASLLCAFSPDIRILVGARAISGIGAALLLPASLAIIRVIWPDPKERGKALGIWAACNGAAFAVGPTLGGLLIDEFGWRSIFLMVVPLGLAALFMAPRYIPESSDRRDRHFDATGQVLGALTLGSLVVAAIESQRFHTIAAAAFACALLALILFLKVEQKRGSGALIPPDMFRIRPFRGAMMATAGMTFGMYGTVFLLPLMWQSEGALGPAGAGLALMPMALVYVLVSTFSGALESAFGTRFMTAGGVAVIGSGLLLIGLTAHTRSLGAAEAGLILTGIGMGLATGPLMGVAVGSVTAARSGSAAALINVARMVGATLGVAALGTVYTLAHDGTEGLYLALLCGGGFQLTTAALAWRSIHPGHAPAV
jgi:DHA2 family methylenomycin A resistance protein-like MFS transporter